MSGLVNDNNDDVTLSLSFMLISSENWYDLFSRSLLFRSKDNNFSVWSINAIYVL